MERLIKMDQKIIESVHQNSSDVISLFWILLVVLVVVGSSRGGQQASRAAS